MSHESSFGRPKRKHADRLAVGAAMMSWPPASSRHLQGATQRHESLKRSGLGRAQERHATRDASTIPRRREGGRDRQHRHTWTPKRCSAPALPRRVHSPNDPPDSLMPGSRRERGFDSRRPLSESDLVTGAARRASRLAAGHRATSRHMSPDSWNSNMIISRCPTPPCRLSINRMASFVSGASR